MLNPPIPRMGGKSKLRKQIIDLIPEHTCYTEPFFGVGWVFFGKEPSKVEVINDIDGELVNLFKMIKYHPDEINNLLQYEISSRDIFCEYKSLPPPYMTEIQRAARVNSDSQLYKQAGNSVTVPVVFKIAKHLKIA